MYYLYRELKQQIMTALRIFTQNTADFAGTLTEGYNQITFAKDKRVIATQKSVNKRINKDAVHGDCFKLGEFGEHFCWTTETNEEIEERLLAENNLKTIFYESVI